MRDNLEPVPTTSPSPTVGVSPTTVESPSPGVHAPPSMVPTTVGGTPTVTASPSSGVLPTTGPSAVDVTLAVGGLLVLTGAVIVAWARARNRAAA
jgi:LPXTG-motif cell wall-anchored protein